jgi:hypothetical protein
MRPSIPWSESSVQRLSVKPVEARASASTERPPSSTEPTRSLTSSPNSEEHVPLGLSAPPEREKLPAAILAVFKAIAMVLAPRLQLLLALIGAFVLALLAMQWQSNIGLAILAAYCALTVIPLIALAWPERGRAA